MNINESLRNVLLFLSGNQYNESSIKEDSLNVRYLEDEVLKSWINYYRQVRQQEINNFIRILREPSRCEFFDHLLYNMWIPFKYSRDAEIESILFGFDIPIGRDFFIELFDKFLSVEERLQLGEKIAYYIHRQQINLYSISRSKFQFYKNNSFPPNNQQICDEIYATYLKKQNNQTFDERDCIAIGHYAELYIYNYLSTNPLLEILWVSRYIGDGYGFDLLTYNKNSTEVCMVEVKGTLNFENTSACLSENEKKVMRSITADNLKYIVYKVIEDPNGIVFHTYVTDKSGIIIHIDPNGITDTAIETPTAYDQELYLSPAPKLIEEKSSQLKLINPNS